MSEYTVQGGDCLWKIAKNQCGAKTNAEIQAKVNEIAQMNNIANPDLIFTGSTLKLPGDTFETQDANKNGETKTQAKADTQPAAANNNTGTKAAVEASAPEANFTVTNLKIFEDFENWRLGYKDAMQAFEDTRDQKTFDESVAEIGGEKFNFNRNDKYEENLKNIANGLFQSLNDGNGVTYDAFLNWYTQGITSEEKRILQDNEDQFRNAFDKLDKDNNTVLDAAEMENMFKAFDKMDKTIDGVITNKDLTNPYQFTAKNFTNI